MTSVEKAIGPMGNRRVCYLKRNPRGSLLASARSNHKERAEHQEFEHCGNLI